jgi:sugar lactone lactonase YvrE
VATKEHEAEVALEVSAQLGEGPVWDERQQRLYFVDIVGHRVHTFWPATGEHRTFDAGRMVGAVVLRDDGGLAIDVEGCLWVACWGGKRVERIDPADGSRRDVVHVPATNTSSVAFGGPALDDLYITTARDGLSDAQLAAEPHAGDLFVTRPGVSGPPAHRFRTT